MASDSRTESYGGRSLWYLKHYGVRPDRIEKRSLEDESVKFGVMVFPPTDSRNFWTYSTNGLSERRMPCEVPPHGDPERRVELVAYTRAESGWVVDLLHELSKYPFVHRSGLALGHTIPVQESSVAPWAGYLLCLPVLEPETFNPLAIDVTTSPDWTFFLQAFGLLKSELPGAIELGGPEFMRQFGIQPDSLKSVQQASFPDTPREVLFSRGV